MANPYVSPSISGYNSSAPSDDGSETEANAIEWQKHIDKIGDPLKSYAQAISSNASTAFGKYFGNDFIEKSASYTISEGDRGKLVVATADALTFTLPPVESVGSNFVVAVLNAGSGDLTVDGNSSETIDGSTTLTLNHDLAWAILVSDSSSWYSLHENGERSVQTITMAADSAFTNDTTLADIIGDFNLRASTWYAFEAVISWTQTGGDAKLAFSFSGTLTDNGHRVITGVDASQVTYDTAGDSVQTTSAITGFTDGGVATIIMAGAFKTNTAGTVALQAAQNTSDSDATTYKAGSFMRLIEQN